MKNQLCFFCFLVFILIANTVPASAQGSWKLKTILHDNTWGSENAPDKIEIGVNEGYIEFSVPQRDACTDRYRFEYKFDQDMNYLDLRDVGGPRPSYSYSYEIKALTGAPCTDLTQSQYSNPYVTIGNGNTSSTYIGELKRANEWPGNYHQHFIEKGSSHWYVHGTSSLPGGAGRQYGSYEVGGINKVDLEYYMKNYEGLVTDFKFIIRAPSNIEGKKDDFYYDVVYIYELARDRQVFDPCSISMPDCSCCPGTIAVWNFDTMQGDCLCPKGKSWDASSQSCR